MLNRRKLMAAGGISLLAGGGTGAHGAEINHAAPGITIMISKRPEGWCVAVPDWDTKPYHQDSTNYAEHPETFMMPTKWMPLNEFLAVFEADT